jgi:hypothetical protein
MTTTPEAGTLVPKIVGNTAPTFRADYNALADWVKNKVVIPVANFAAIATAFPSPVQGLQVQTADTLTTWMYYGAYNSVSNKAGARVAGWYPIPSSLVSVHADWNQQIVFGLQTLTAGFVGGSLPLFSVPRGRAPLPLSGGIYQDEAFSINVNGDISVKREGLYDITAFTQWSNQATVNQFYITKNNTAIANDATILGGADMLGSTAAAQGMLVNIKAAPLLTTDVVRVLARNNTGANTGIGYGPFPASAQLDIRWAGVRAV